MNHTHRIIFTAMIMGACAGAAARDETRIPMDGFAAVVNDKIITVRETLAAMQPLERQMQQSYKGDELRDKLQQAYTNTLESLIERELILDSFRRQQGSIPDNVVNSRMEEIERTRFNRNRADLLKALDAENMTMDEWRESLRNTMIVSFMREREVDAKIVVSPQAERAAHEAEMENFQAPTQVELRMIAINRGKTDEEWAIKHKQAEDVRRLILAGQDFAEAARLMSEGTKAADGGYWGWIDPQTRRLELAEAIAGLDVGAVSEIIATDDMLYIVKIEGRRNAGHISFEEVQDKIREELRRRQTKELYDAWMQRLKRDAFIRRF